MIWLSAVGGKSNQCKEYQVMVSKKKNAIIIYIQEEIYLLYIIENIYLDHT